MLHSLYSLPFEVIENIFKYLSLADRFKIMNVNKTEIALFSSQNFWQFNLRNDYLAAGSVKDLPNPKSHYQTLHDEKKKLRHAVIVRQMWSELKAQANNPKYSLAEKLISDYLLLKSPQETWKQILKKIATLNSISEDQSKKIISNENYYKKSIQFDSIFNEIFLSNLPFNQVIIFMLALLDISEDKDLITISSLWTLWVNKPDDYNSDKLKEIIDINPNYLICFSTGMEMFSGGSLPPYADKEINPEILDLNNLKKLKKLAGTFKKILFNMIALDLNNLFELLIHHHPDLIKFDLTSRFNHSLLNCTIYYSNYALTKLLIEKGADVNQGRGVELDYGRRPLKIFAYNLDALGRSPLYCAIKRLDNDEYFRVDIENIEKIILLLLTENANFNQKCCVGGIINILNSEDNMKTTTPLKLAKKLIKNYQLLPAIKIKEKKLEKNIEVLQFFIQLIQSNNLKNTMLTPNLNLM